MASTPIETLLEGKGFSCEAGGNWTSGEGQGIGCVAFGACYLHSSTTGTKTEETEPSAHIWISEEGREDSLFEGDWSRTILLPVQCTVGNEGGNGEVGRSPWGKGEHIIRVSCGDGRD